MPLSKNNLGEMMAKTKLGLSVLIASIAMLAAMNANATNCNSSINSQGKWVMSGSCNTDSLAVHYDDKTQSSITLQGDAGTTISNLAPGAVTATSTQAVNGSQLYTTNQNVQTVNGRVDALQSQVNTNTGAIAANSAAIAAETARATSAEAGMQTQINTTNSNVTSLQGQVATNTSNIASNTSAIGALQQNSATHTEVTNAISTANSYTNTQVSTGVQSANAYTDKSSAQAVQTSKTYTDQSSAQSVKTANSYTDVAVASGVKQSFSYTDQAVTTGVKQANAYTDQRYNQLTGQMSDYRKDANGGISSAMAVAGLPQPTRAGASMVSAAASTYHGETGLAMGLSHVTGDNRWVMKGAVTTNSRGDFGAAVGAGFQF